MHVPFLDLEAQTRSVRDRIDEAISRVIDDTDFILGKPVSELEERIPEYCGVRLAAGVASGTDALLLSLKASGVGPGELPVSEKLARTTLALPIHPELTSQEQEEVVSSIRDFFTRG